MQHGTRALPDSLGGARRHHCWLLVGRRRDSFEARRKLWPDDAGEHRQDRYMSDGARQPGGQICNEVSWSFHPDKEYQVAVWLRQASLPSVPVCAGDSSPDARCAARDDALSERQQLNTQELECVLAALSARVDVMATIWYELPYHRTSGEPVPIGLAFGLSLSHSQIDALVQHPFVEKVEPWPGSAISQHVAPVPAPVECPKEVEPAAPKLDGITSIQNQGRRPVVIELRDDGVLPAPNGAIDNLWERTILNTRELTCVRRKIDAFVQQDSFPVNYSTLTGDPLAPQLPPVSQAAVTLKAFGRGLTWEEAAQIAESPLIEGIWTSDAIQFEQPTPGCPLDLTAPIPMVDCTTDQQPIDAKITDADRMRFQPTTGPMPVIVSVAGGARNCPLPACSAQPCPERDSITSRMQAENFASQRCVRDLIASLGGAADPAAMWLINTFGATLTWEQIQAVAAHPHVVRVESNGGTPPP